MNAVPFAGIRFDETRGGPGTSIGDFLAGAWGSLSTASC